MDEMYKKSEELYLPLSVSPSSLMNLSLHWQLHETIAAANELGIFEQLCTERSANEIAEVLNLDAQCTFYLLKVLVRAGYLTENGDKFINLPVANTFLLSGHYLYLGHEFKFQQSEHSFGGKLLLALRNGSAGPTPEPQWNQERLRQLGVFGLMGSIQSTVNAVDLSDAQRLLDLGGGHGFYSIAFAQKYPTLHATVFDLSHIVSLAEKFARQFAIERQVAFCGGDFLIDDIGKNYDAILCANVLHSQKRDVVLTKVRQALKPGGRIIVKCRVSDSPDNLENAIAKLMWQVRGGRELYSSDQWKSFLLKHGFREIEMVQQFGIYATMIGRN